MNCSFEPGRKGWGCINDAEYNYCPSEYDLRCDKHVDKFLATAQPFAYLLWTANTQLGRPVH